MEKPINPAKVQLEKVNEGNRQILWNLLQYMIFETSPYGKNDINTDGTFDYKFFDKYFTDDDREAYLIKSDNGGLLGFVMINQYLQKVQKGHAIAEFMILPRFRRMGIGKEIAKRCLAMYPGNWEISPADGSKQAYGFWKNVVDDITENDNQLKDGLFIIKVGE